MREAGQDAPDGEGPVDAGEATVAGIEDDGIEAGKRDEEGFG